MKSPDDISSPVAEALDRAIRERGKAVSIAVDNGSGFSGKVMDAWSDFPRVRLAFIRPGNPAENGFIESFNWRLRAEGLPAQANGVGLHRDFKSCSRSRSDRHRSPQRPKSSRYGWDENGEGPNSL